MLVCDLLFWGIVVNLPFHVVELNPEAPSVGLQPHADGLLHHSTHTLSQIGFKPRALSQHQGIGTAVCGVPAL